MAPVLRLGLADHLGWAVCVTASEDHQVVDRRRIELMDAALSPAPIHYDRGRSDDDTVAALIAEARAATARKSAAAFDELMAALPGTIASISLRSSPPDFPTDIETQRRAPYEARADAIMYRQVIAEVAHGRGWEVHLYAAKTVERRVAEVLGPRADEILRRPRQTLGPPWTKDHRVALAATIVAAGG